MSENELNVDSSILQFTPKGEFYDTAEKKNEVFANTIDSFFKFNRSLFALVNLLPGTAYSHGVFTHKLLSNPQPEELNGIVTQLGVDSDYEVKIISLALQRETQPRALKNLLMLAGKRGFTPVNNARTRRVILSYIFNRSPQSLAALVTKYKSKVATLVRHAIGIQHLSAILNDQVHIEQRGLLFNKYIGRYFQGANGMVVLYHLFNKEIPLEITGIDEFPKVTAYSELRKSAKTNNTSEFLKILESSGLPVEVGLGFRNTYKLDIELAKIIDLGKKTERQKIQMQASAKRAGTEIEVDFSKQDIYDLWKLFYFELQQEDSDLDLMSQVMDAIENKEVKKLPMDLGKIAVIFDVSKSMTGSTERKLHPFLTGVCIIASLDVNSVHYVGGTMVETGIKPCSKIVVPSGSTDLTSAFVEAIKTKPNTIVIISDGYENQVKGAFELFYNKFKTDDFSVIHINPVYASEVGSMRKLTPDIKPISLTDYKMFETSMIFDLLVSHPDEVISLLVARFKKQIPLEVSKT